MIKSVKSDLIGVFLPVLTGNMHLECYSDASSTNLSDCGSWGGIVIFIVDGSGKRSPNLWKSREKRRVVMSKLAAEPMSLLDVAESAYYIRKPWKILE